MTRYYRYQPSVENFNLNRTQNGNLSAEAAVAQMNERWKDGKNVRFPTLTEIPSWMLNDCKTYQILEFPSDMFLETTESITKVTLAEFMAA